MKESTKKDLIYDLTVSSFNMLKVGCTLLIYFKWGTVFGLAIALFFLLGALRKY
ncbi:hypothetical protein [Oceanobacillus profundus]|uniref:hypothetical protein n=1 Tax=Oceanobacillus profundus TaxID=372463 RepID=UPI0013141209|nr:hypothetical protein [Oceanobacillus profundus]MBR2246283.1 hypothetical protein [Bacilli bacterium]MBR3119692.1 hypothetical protein [Oceanobacillus sp.]